MRWAEMTSEERNRLVAEQIREASARTRLPKT